VFAQESLRHNAKVDIFKKDTVSPITELMSKLKVQVTTLVSNVPMLSSYGYPGLLIIGGSLCLTS
jgi:hypothetical protein